MNQINLSTVIKLIGLFIFILPNLLYASHLHKESVYRDAWCQGQTEVRLYDGSRVDCLTTNYAVEVEFASKAYESLGQAIHYARITGKEPAMLLIIEKQKDWKHYNRIKKTAQERGVKLWHITPNQLPSVSAP